MKHKLIEVYRARGEGEAELVRSKLESYGISSIVRSNAAPSVIPFTVDGLGEYKVLVWEESAEEAKNLLKEEEPNPDSSTNV